MNMDLNILITLAVLIASIAGGFATMRTQIKNLAQKIEDLNKEHKDSLDNIKTNHLAHLQASYSFLENKVNKLATDVAVIKMMLKKNGFKE